MAPLFVYLQKGLIHHFAPHPMLKYSVKKKDKGDYRCERD